MDINAIMADLAQYTRIMEEAAATVEGLKDQLKQYMQAHALETIAGAEHKCSWKTVQSSRVDTTALKKDFPDIVAAYTRMTESKRFTFN